MKCRIARHTSDLSPIIHFYNKILEMEVLGSFQDHCGYSGVFLGYKDQNWHLEFTVSEELPNHNPDEDDLLVLYAGTKEEYIRFLAVFKENDIKPVEPKNPYWKENGVTVIDPDGFRVVISDRFIS